MAPGGRGTESGSGGEWSDLAKEQPQVVSVHPVRGIRYLAQVKYKYLEEWRLTNTMGDRDTSRQSVTTLS